MLSFGLNQSSAEQVLHHLRLCATDFVPPLETRVELDAYAAKLVARASRFECWRAGALVGLVAAYFNSDDRIGFITNVSVTPQEQRQGIAAQLLAQCVKAAEDAGLERVRLEVGHENHGALRLYKAAGFLIVERGAEQVVMALQLPAQSAGGGER